MKKYIFILIITLVPIVYCEKDREEPATSFVYPLKTGNRWEYGRNLYYFNFNPESLEIPFPDTLTAMSSVEILDKTILLDTLETYKIR